MNRKHLTLLLALLAAAIVAGCNFEEIDPRLAILSSPVATPEPTPEPWEPPAWFCELPGADCD